MQPPLAAQGHSEALWSQLAAGDIEIIESDYAPHSVDAKMATEQANPAGHHGHNSAVCFGVPGIEHVGSMLLRQAQLGEIRMERLVDAMHTQPLRMLRMDAPPNTEVTWHLETYRIGETDVSSGSGWTPYAGALGAGRVAKVVINGSVLYERQAA